jgi:hypothetical protein
MKCRECQHYQDLHRIGYNGGKLEEGNCCAPIPTPYKTYRWGGREWTDRAEVVEGENEMMCDCFKETEDEKEN